MAISEIELRYIVNNIKEVIDSVYYVSNISLITKNALIIKFHHSQKNDVSLLVSSFGICITKYKYSILEDNESLKKIKSDLERSKLIDVSVVSGERIVEFVFQSIQGMKYYLIVELFGHGNIIICNESHKILNILNPINVRHRVLKPGLKYFPPPSRGADPLSLDYDAFLSLIKNSDQGNIDIKKWLGRTLSISKKFIELAVQNSKISNKKVKDLTSVELKTLFEELTSLIKNILTGVGHEPCIILDDDDNPADVSPITPSDVPPDHIRKYSLYTDAIDDLLNYSVLHTGSLRNSELEKQIESLEHDLNEQIKAKDLVISKSNKLRGFANLLMQETDGVLNPENHSIAKLLYDSDAKILSIKGKDYLEIVDEKIVKRVIGLLLERDTL